MTESIRPFLNHLPVRVQFGNGCARELGSLVASLGRRQIALLVDEGIELFNPKAAEVLAGLSGPAVTRIDKPAGEPTIAMVDEAAREIGNSGAEVVVALGGGSVMDTAKAARVCVQHGCDFATFLSGQPGYPPPEVPLIAVPTSAGTGSEVSGGAVITDPVSGRKAGIAHPYLRADHAIVDPELTWSMPPAMTANVGVDALAQAMAAVLARVSTPIGDAIALEAVRMIGRSLVPAYRNGQDHGAREEMACGSLMGGLAMNISDCTAEHSLGQAIGGLTGAPHGLTIGLVLVETLERERRHLPERCERLADALGVPPDDTEDGTRLVKAISRLLAELDFPVLASLEVGVADLDRLTDAALSDYFITMSPEPWRRDEVYAAFRSALETSGRERRVS